MTFGERIVRAREKKGLNQKQLAELLEISPTRLNYWEKDKREPDVPMILKLIEVLDVSGDWLIGHDDSPTPVSSGKNFLATQPEIAHIQKYRRLTDNGRATVDHVIDGLLEAGQSARDQESKDSEKILKKVAARGGTGEPLEATPDTARLLEETKEWRREQIKNSDVF